MADDLVDRSPIENHETLLRRVEPNRGHFFRVGGELKKSSQAFTDRERCPSVDRLKICEQWGGAKFTQLRAENGVLRITAEEIRSTGADKRNPKGEVVQRYKADVHPDPLEHDPARNCPNSAHCEIRLDPKCDNDRAFKRFIESLAQLASWEMEPPP